VKRLLRPLPLVVIVGTIALVSLLAYGLASGNGASSTLDDAVARGERPQAPNLGLPPLDGRGPNRTLADYRGKVVVLNVWASWCVPCRDESPLLERWHRRIVPKGGTVVGVDVQDIDSDARKFIADFGMTYPQLRDKEGDHVRSAYSTVGYPETFVIDRRGRVAALQRGPVDDEFMRETVEPLLKEPAA
jgi:cytochrome c biogenesis protein CcmG/thiol:disulfide interchange protein DsbE